MTPTCEENENKFLPRSQVLWVRCVGERGAGVEGSTVRGRELESGKDHLHLSSTSRTPLQSDRGMTVDARAQRSPMRSPLPSYQPPQATRGSVAPTHHRPRQITPYDRQIPHASVLIDRIAQSTQIPESRVTRAGFLVRWDLAARCREGTFRLHSVGSRSGSSEFPESKPVTASA